MTPSVLRFGDKDSSRAWTLSSLCGCEARKEVRRCRKEESIQAGDWRRQKLTDRLPGHHLLVTSDSFLNTLPCTLYPPTSNLNMTGRYTHAVVRGVPTSLAQEADGQVDLARAQRESGVYSGILRQKLGLQVMELPANEDLPRGQLIGDTAVVIADTALITRPAIPARRKETEGLQKLFEELKFRVCELTDENATLDASDILYTGSEIFVGLSKWTNLRGAEIVAKAYQDYAVSTVPVSGDLHLKSFCSMGGPDTLIIGTSDCARKALKMMEQLTDHHYETLTVPDDPAANCIYARVGPKSNVLVHRSAEEYPNSVQVFQKLTDYTLVPASCTEMSKLGGCLTACSILINRKVEI